MFCQFCQNRHKEHFQFSAGRSLYIFHERPLHLYICYNHAIFILGIWSLRVGSTDYDDFIVLSFVGQTR